MIHSTVPGTRYLVINGMVPAGTGTIIHTVVSEVTLYFARVCARDAIN